MDFTQLWETLQGSLGTTVPSVLGALGILIVGWIVAVVVRAVLRRGLGLIKLNHHVESSTGSVIDLEKGLATGAFWLILLVVLIAFFNALKLEQVSGSLQTLVDQVMAFVPKLVAGGVLIIVAWLLATIVRTITTKALAATTLDEKLSAEAGMKPMSDTAGQVLFWLVILLFLPAILGVLGLNGLLTPVQGMVDKVLAMLPNILAAAAIALVGWFLARILRDLVTNLLAVAGADKLGARAGLTGKATLSRLVGLLVYIFIFVPALIAALNALKIEAISQPATDMLGSLMSAIPNIFAAAIIIAVAYLVSGFIATLVTSLLAGMGFDRLPERLGMGQAFPEDALSPSQLVGRIIVFFVMLFAIVEAANRLGFEQVSEIVAMLIEFGGQVLLGVVIIAVGFWLSGLAYAAIRRVAGRKKNAAAVANLARFAILGIVIAMGLRAMGLADDIVNLAFGLTLGAIAVAFALSFGLGGREAAGKQMDHWLGKLRTSK
ncbi:MAG: mechanosensitive ion channel [Phycisphaerales bacterium]|nr:mechanosensitive ion channel [Phycisphaerales bacterium]NNM26797.1 mechanosensitive ion channel [Phycisphaerales bacterium]